MTLDFSTLKRYTFSSFNGWLAMGLGSGLVPKGPGTAGSALAVILMYPISQLSFGWQAGWVTLAALVGIGICQQATKTLNVHDHPAIVWDEFVGMWLVLLWVSPSLLGWGVAFILFRLFDIAKPWPIGWLDQKVKGGLGIMLDDLLAAIFALITLWVINLFWPMGFSWQPI